MLLQEQI